jgi:hypothetical protein
MGFAGNGLYLAYSIVTGIYLTSGILDNLY